MEQLREKLNRLTMIDYEDEMVTYFRSKEFQESFQKRVEADTWEKGRPKIYMNDKKQIVEHWDDGTINILKDNVE